MKGVQGKSASRGNTHVPWPPTRKESPAASWGWGAAEAGLFLGGGVGAIIALRAIVRLKGGQGTGPGKSRELLLPQQRLPPLPERKDPKKVTGYILLAALGGITMAAGGYLLYHRLLHMSVPSGEGFSNDERKLLLDIINTGIDIKPKYKNNKPDIQYDYLDYSDSTNDDKGEMVFGVNPKEPVFNGAKYRDIFNDISQSLLGIKQKAKDNNLDFAVKVFEDVDNKVKISQSPTHSMILKFKGITNRLLNYIVRLEKWFNLSEASDNEHFNKYFEIHGDLWALANRIPDIKNEVDKFREEHPFDELMRSSKARSLFGRDFSAPELKNKIRDALHAQLADSKHFSAPILSPESWLHNKISLLIQEYKKAHPEAKDIIGITPDTMITVVWTVKDYKIYPMIKFRDPRDPPIPPHNHSLMEIATGLHVNEPNKGDPKQYVIEYKIPGQDSNSYSPSLGERALAPLIEHLQSRIRDNMETVMKAELATYRNNSEYKNGAVVFFRAMMTLRCLAYLDQHEKNQTEYTQAVTQFLANKNPGREVIYWGQQVSGVFFVPLVPGGNNGLLFSIDDDRVVVLKENLNAPGDDFTLPNTEEFKTWWRSKLPIKFAHYRSGLAKDVGRQKRHEFIGERSRSIGISFKTHDNPVSLATGLFEGMMTRLELDIDSLIWSYAEQNQIRWLDIVKRAMGITGVTLGMLSMFAGGCIPLMIATIAGGMAASAVDIAASVLQAGIVDTEKQRAAYIREALLAGTFAVAGFIVGDLPQLNNNITTLLKRYRNLRPVSESYARSLHDGLKAAGSGKHSDELLRELEGLNVISKTKPATLALLERHPTSNSFWDAARALRNKIRPGTMSERDCVVDILEKGYKFSKDEARHLRQTLTSAAEGRGSVDALFHSSSQRSITNAGELINVPAGQLVVVTENGKAVHFMVGVGNGRFASTGHRYLDADLGGAMEIITAEEVGIITRPGGGVNLQRSGAAELQIYAGYPVNCPTKAIPPIAHTGGGQSRIQDLLGPDAGLHLHSTNNKVLEVTMHGAPAAANYMDGSELSHAIKGAAISKEGLAAFNMTDTIRLYSCNGAWWGKYSSGQMLANFSKKKVEAYRGILVENRINESNWWAKHCTIFTPASTPGRGWSAELSIHRGLHSLQMKLLSIRRTYRTYTGRGTRDVVTNTDIDALLSSIVRFCTSAFTVNELIKDESSFADYEIKLKEMADAPKPDDDIEFMERCVAVIMCNDIVLKKLNIPGSVAGV